MSKWIELGNRIAESERGPDGIHKTIATDVMSAANRKLFIAAPAMQVVLEEANRILSWIPDSEEVMDMRGLPEAQRLKAREQQAKITELKTRIAQTLAFSKQ